MSLIDQLKADLLRDAKLSAYIYTGDASHLKDIPMNEPMPCGNTAAHSKYQREQDAAIADAQELDFEDDRLMKELCGDRLAKPIQRLLVLRSILSTVSDAHLRADVKEKLDDLLAGVNEEMEDA